MSATEAFIKGLQEATGKDPFPEKFWGDYPEKATHTFQDALDKYAEYYQTLNPEQQKQMSALFWNQIKKIGTPIIENFSDEEVKVHFLFPRDNYDHETKKLYISGDFHGFTSSDNDRQEMHHKLNTDIMHRSDVMPRDSVVTYNFLQVPPEYQNKSRQELTGEALPKSFYDMEEIPELGNDPLIDSKSDAYAKHTDIGRSIFCANVDNNLSGIHLFKDTDWKKLLTEEYPGYLKNLTHKGTYFCDMNNFLRKDENPANDYMKKIWNVNDKENTRSVSVFQSGEGKVDNLIIIHDGVSYMGTGTLERIDALIEEEKIPKNTAIICISQLPGLIEKYKRESPEKFAKATDPRPIEYGSRIDDYIKFIDQTVSQLGYSGVPAMNRTLIGSSMSGTASVYMILKHKDKFGNAIVQAPTEGTRDILRPLMQERLEAKKLKKEVEDLSGRIHLSCGKFETLEYAQNIRLAHTKELAEILGSNNQALPVDDTGNYGHLPHSWSQELTKPLPLLQQQSLMQAAYIPGISIAAISQGEIQSSALGYADTQSKSRVKADTQFWACSLSKPVFAYLVLKLTKDGSLGYNRILMRKEEPKIEDMGIGDLVALHEDGQLTIYWKENGKIVNRSFREEMVQSILKRLPTIGNESTDLNFIKEITSQYGCPSYLDLDQVLPWDEKLLGDQGDKKPLTPRMILSHQTGLPNEGHPDEKFNPGDGFRYSGEGFLYLQKMITQRTGKSLEELAQTRLFEPLKMTRTTFLFPEEGDKAKTHDEAMVPNPIPKQPANNSNAAGSLHTTASDYARFLKACMDDKDFIDLITPQINSMEKDIDAKEKRLDSETLKPIDWGLGFGLQKDKSGNIVSAFHWGHGPGARTFFAINLEHPQSAVVYLTNSENGLAVAKDIATPIVGDITPLMKFLSDKYGYEDIHAPNWKEYHECLIAGVSAENEGNFDLAIKSYKEAAKAWQANLANKWFDCVLTSNKEPTLESIQPNTLVMLLEDQMLTVYWLEKGKIKNASFSENSVPEITKFLSLVNENSNDKKLIEAIISQYGCTPKKHEELSHRIVIAEEKNKQDNLDVKVFKKLTGEYGPLTISVVNESILQINDGSPNSPRDLKWINNDTFLDVNGGNVMLKFKCNESRNPISLSCYFPSGANFLFPVSKSNKSELSISSKSFFSQPQKQQADVGNKKHGDKKMTKDDTAFQSTKEKKASQEFTSTTEKKRATSTDDFNITYGKRPGK
ncbi:MAG: serine hydrolase [Gammaproteobacteria bacterium]|nr:serine hydrolase [Gammaproteobacteria bacterium]MCW5583373.1 serine hydrolase [Gammaproteobacteria bacterium]